MMNEGKRPDKLIALIILTTCFFVAGTFRAGAQTAEQASTEIRTPSRRLTMDQTIVLAQERSISSMINENIYASAYWNYRYFKASRLPSLNLRTGIANVERSMVQVQNYETGEYTYRPVFTLSNDLSLYIQQRISATGGTLSIASSLRRFDQFAPDNLTWYSQPFTLQYTQPLFTYNSMKWAKKIDPSAYEAAEIEYIENMESVTITAAGYFWSLALAELNRDIDLDNYENSKRLHRIAQERYEIGAVPRDQVLQMQLRVLTDSIAITNSHIAYITQKNRLTSYIGMREDADITLDIDYTLPEITLDYQMVLATAMKNSSFEINQKIELLRADQSIAQAKGNRGIDVSFNARFGLSQSAESFSKAYSHLRDQQVAGFSIGVPILDWGMGHGRVKMAESQAETTRYRLEQARIDFEQDILVRVMQFNAQRAQCEASMRSKNIADERYALSVGNFERGAISVTELNQARTDKDSAQRAYLSSLNTYWNYYFNLRKLSLYDYISHTNIGDGYGDAEFDKLIE